MLSKYIYMFPKNQQSYPEDENLLDTSKEISDMYQNVSSVVKGFLS